MTSYRKMLPLPARSICKLSFSFVVKLIEQLYFYDGEKIFSLHISIFGHWRINNAIPVGETAQAVSAFYNP